MAHGGVARGRCEMVYIPPCEVPGSSNTGLFVVKPRRLEALSWGLDGGPPPERGQSLLEERVASGFFPPCLFFALSALCRR